MTTLSPAWFAMYESSDDVETQVQCVKHGSDACRTAK